MENEKIPKDKWRKDEKFDKEMRKTIRELNDLRRRLAVLTESSDTATIGGVLDFGIMVDFVMGVPKETLMAEHGIEIFDEAKPYWEMLEWK